MRYLIGLSKIVAAGVMVGGFAGVATAQESGDETEHVQRPTGQRPVLAGPKVKETRLPGVEDTLDGAAQRMAGMSEQAVPMPVFREMLLVLTGEDLSDDVRLTAEQQQRLREIGDAHTRATRELMNQHKDEIATLRRAVREEAGMSDREAQPQRGGSDAASTLRRRVGEIRRQGPSETALQTKLWSVLNDPQRTLIEAEIQTWRDERWQERMDRSRERFLNDRRDAPPATRGPSVQRERAMGPRDALSSRLRASIARLDPEARQRLVDRLSKRWIERDASRANETKRPGRPTDKPTKPTDTPRRKRGG